MFRKLKLFLLVLFSFNLFAFSIQKEHAIEIGNRIWKNECAGTLMGLTNWKQGEGFASFGIGHFIWYSKGKSERFKETFPELIRFIEKNGKEIPDWMKEYCPWNSREEFIQEIESPKMKELREVLYDTRELQALFIANRLKDALKEIEKISSETEQTKITHLVQLLSKEADGLYAMIDYLNFKGDGTSLNETYQGKGWGLRQVFLQMPKDSKKPLEDFVQAAKFILSQRVENAPQDRDEKRWLKGWHNRLDTYLKNLNNGFSCL